MKHQHQRQGLSLSRRTQRSRAGSTQLKVMFSCVVLGLIALGGWYSFSTPWRANAAPAGAITAPVEKSRFRQEVVERGDLESANNVEIRCEVKSKTGSTSTSILWIIAEGSFVKPGDKVVEFDASSLREQETQQRITYEQARATVIQATLAHETAKIAVQEYLNGTFNQEKQTIEGEIVVAEENLRRAQDYAKFSEKLAGKGYVTDVQLEADKFAVKNAELALANARLKLSVLQQYTRAKMLKQLETDVGTTEAQMLAQQASFKLEEEKLDTVREQIAKCVVFSPSAGQVVYANETDRRGNSEVQIVEGMAVRERQVIVRLPDPANMQVKARIKEGRISLIKPGQRAMVQLDALKGAQMQGRVTRVDPIALSSFFSSVKEYATYITIENPPAGLKPGMTAEVSIQVEDLPSAIHVPVQAVVERNGKHYVGLATAMGPKVKEVQVGINNDLHVVVTSGLREDQVVYMSPEEILGEALPKAVPQQRPEMGPSQVVAAPGTAAPEATGAPSGAPVPAGSARPRPSPAAMVQQFDRDGDGKLSADEVPEGMKPRFSQLDSDGDGNLDPAELAKGRSAGGARPAGDGAAPISATGGGS